jgi:hypothetical protein
MSRQMYQLWTAKPDGRGNWCDRQIGGYVGAFAVSSDSP